jgi:bifunctional non-homologous end joining protein LigD
MLALLVPKPFHRPGWVFEEKYDGIRILACKECSKVTLLSRNDLDRTVAFAEIAAAIGQLRDRTLILDGEVVAFDGKGVSRFQFLQRGALRCASRSSIAFIAMAGIFAPNRLLPPT